MDLAWMLGTSRREVQEVFPGLHGHQVKGLAQAVVSMIAVEHCQLSRMALTFSATGKVPSGERRLQRLVANPRLDARKLEDQWAKEVLRDARQVTLILDETPNHDKLRAMKISRQVRGRAIPLLWTCYAPDALPMSQDEVVMDLLERTARSLPPGAEPALLADRGLSWPRVLGFCVEHGWHYVLRVQGQTRVKLADGTEVPIRSLVPKRGRTWCGSAQVFKKAGWRNANVVAHWPVALDDPWLLVTDLPASRHRCRQYCKRMRIELSFRDEKSSGFHWNQSRIRDPEHAARLLLAMALAMRFLIRLGQWLIRTGKDRCLERAGRHVFSVFQLGLRYVHFCLYSLHPPSPPKSVGK
jgi:hypothetical protein